MARHGGGGSGGGFDKHTVSVSKETAVIPFVLFYGLCTMPKRWPRATKRVFVYSFLLSLAYPFGSVDPIYSNTWMSVILLFLGARIAYKHMPDHEYHPSPIKTARQERERAALTKYDHLRDVRTWNDHYSNKKGTS